MSRIIKMTPEYLTEVRKEFEEALSNGKFADGRISFTKTLTSVKRKATVFFTETAWLKMQSLVREFNKEVAWHGVAHRLDNDLDQYIIEDIVVYPQEVTGSAVEMDTEKYAGWLMKNAEDERFDHLFMQGHSHVNLGTSPSSVDLQHQEEILNMMGNADFYIFMIWNKRNEKTIKIYDLAENVMFETADVTVEVLNDGPGLNRFLKEAKEMVKDKPIARSAPTYQGNSLGGYSGGQSGYYGSYNGLNKKEAPETSTTVTQPQGSGKKKKGKRNRKRNNGTDVSNTCAGQCKLTLFDESGTWEDTYISDPFYARGY